MNLKHWTVVGVTALALVACGSPAATNPTPATEATTTSGSTAATAAATGTGETVARVGDVSLTRGELDDRIKRIQDSIKATAGDAQVPAALDIEKSLVNLFVNEVLTLNVANQRNVSVSDQEVDAQIKNIGDSIASQGGTLEQAITGQLGYANAEAPEFRMLISSIVARQKVSETLVTTDTVEQEVRTSVEAQGKEEVQKADVRHILVATEDEAKKVIERLNNGEKFEDLAKELSTDPGSKDNGGLYEGIEPGQFVPEFDKAMFEDLEPGETTAEPVKTDFGYHVIRLEKRETAPRYTAEQIEQQITEQIPAVLDQRRQEEFEKLVEAEREKATTAGTLVEPTYPEPTPEVPGELPSDVAPAETPGAEAPAAETPAADATAAPQQ